MLDELLVVLFANLAATQDNTLVIHGWPNKITDLLLDLHKYGVRVNPNRPVGGVGVLHVPRVM